MFLMLNRIRKIVTAYFQRPHLNMLNATSDGAFGNSIIIEVVGFPGIGKTTLLSEILNQGTEKELGFKSRNDLKKLLSNESLQRQILQIADESNFDLGIYENLVQKKLLALWADKALSFKRKVALQKFFMHCITIDIFGKLGCGRKGILLDEGLFHNFQSELVAICEEELADNPLSLSLSLSLERWFANRLIINLVGSMEDVIDRQIKRRIGYLSGETTKKSLLNDLNEQELSLLYLDYFKKNKKLMTFMDHINVKYITLSSEQTARENARLVLGFIRNKI